MRRTARPETCEFHAKRDDVQGHVLKPAGERVVFGVVAGMAHAVVIDGGKVRYGSCLPRAVRVKTACRHGDFPSGVADDPVLHVAENAFDHLAARAFRARATLDPLG